MTAACGDGIDYDPINGIPTDNLPSTELPDNTPTDFALEMITPLPGSIDNSPLDEIVLAANEAINPSTLSSTTAWITERESKRLVPCTVRLRDDKTVVLIPKFPLAVGARYTAHVDGLSSIGQDEPYELSEGFRIATHLNSQRTIFADGVGTQLYDSSFDEETSTYTVNVFRAGPDAVLGTDDDFQAHRSDFIYDSMGDVVETLVRSGAGVDEIFGTEDDDFLYRRVSEYDARGLNRTYHLFAGPDKRLDTDDDYQDNVLEYSYDDNDDLVQFCGGTSGADQIAFTEDDVFDRCTSYINEPSQKLVLSYNDAGLDGMFGTEDDVLNTWSRQNLDSNGVLTSVERFSAVEGKRIDSNEGKTGNTVVTYDENGLIVGSLASAGPGEDRIWGTNDDQSSSRSVRTYDANGFPLTLKSINAGDDQLAQTGDDETVSIVRW